MNQYKTFRTLSVFILLFFIVSMITLVNVENVYAVEDCNSEEACSVNPSPDLFSALNAEVNESTNVNEGVDVNKELNKFGITHDEKSICILYFYGDTCSVCARIKPFIDSLSEKYGAQISIHKFEIYKHLNNYQLYNQFCGIQDIPITERGVPFIAINHKFFMGYDQIHDNLENEIQSMIESGERICPMPDVLGCHDSSLSNYTSSDVNGTIPGLEGEKITLPLVIGAGLIDGINPCAFAVLLFLLTFLLEVSNNKKRMVKAGTAYVIAVYVSYFLAGLGLLSIIQFSGMSRIVVIAASIFAIFAGIVNIKDYFWYGKGFSLKIPESKKKLIEEWTHKANVPAALVLGFLVSMFELPCTGGVYLAILAMLAGNGGRIYAVPYLLIYNLMFILPLIVIILAVTFGMKAEHIENWRNSRKNIMKLAMGILLLLLGLGLLLGWF